MENVSFLMKMCDIIMKIMLKGVIRWSRVLNSFDFLIYPSRSHKA